MLEDLRGFLRRIETTTYLHRQYTSEVGLDEIARIIYEQNTSGCILLFPNIRQHEGVVVANTSGSRKLLALALRCQENDLWSVCLTRMNRPCKPRVVKSVRYEEVSYSDGDVNLFKLPILKYNERETTPYITGGIVIVKDPDTAIQNASINRMQVVADNKLLIRAEPKSDLARIFTNASRLSERLPVAICIGNHPVEMLVAACQLPFETDELWYVGGLQSEPLPVAVTNEANLLVPASTEIVLEGFIDLKKREKEGPFGDFLGFYVGSEDAPVIEVTRLSHARFPIYQAVRAGSQEDTLLLGFWKEIVIYRTLKSKGIDVVSVSMGPNVLVCRIAIRKKNQDEVWEAAETAFECYPWLKICILLDPDLEMGNWLDVWWAFSNRWSVKTGTRTYKTVGVDRELKTIYSHGIAIDATIPPASTELLRARPASKNKTKGEEHDE